MSPVDANRFAQRRASALGLFAQGLGQAADTGALLITNPLDVAYLTGFHGGDSFLVLAARESVVISDSRFTEEMKELDGTGVRTVIRSKGIIEATGDIVSQLGARVLGLQAEHVTLARKAAMASAMKPTGIRAVEVTNLVAKLRTVKDELEVKAIKQAVKWQEDALEATLDQVGKLLKKDKKVTESHLAAILEFEMKTRGSSEPSFETIVGAGANAALPHYHPGDVAIKKGKPVLIDFGAVCDGYHSDMTRVVCFGEFPAKLAKVYEIVRAAHEQSAKALGPGVNGKTADGVARKIITDAGFGPQFGHSLGHGIGLQIHEDPRLTHIGQAEDLQPGMVVTVEPGIYLPGVGGVRLEDDYVITEKGAKNLCSLPMDLDWATR